MSWITDFLTSSIGRKIIMSLTGIFLITFLIVHLAGNLQLLKSDGGEAFNLYAYFMTSNPLIKAVSYGLYFFILLHTVVGIALWAKNKKAKGKRNAMVSKESSTWASRNMALLGTLIFAFILIHMGDFWLKMKLDQTPYATYDGQSYKDLYALCMMTFSNVYFVIAYVIGMIVLGFHLWHGFQSAFQTLGLNHPKYTPIIKGLGKIFSIVVPLGFAVIPVYMYLFMK
ncbi:MAG: succinate dehydrogenase cytochrome b subunit [Saprospiraceae bacterium]|nr:succinate dehydrogenase cytochrome b subunit [Saprospiraceae bacterium]